MPKTTPKDLRLAVNHVLASLLFYVGRMGTRIEATSIRADLEIPETVACAVSSEHHGGAADARIGAELDKLLKRKPAFSRPREV